MNPGNVIDDQERMLPASAGIADVHAAWLDVAAIGDVAAMRRLRDGFSQWLGMQQLLVDLATTRRSSYDEFRLRTIGASALYTAAWRGDLDVMQFVLESGQSPDTGDDGTMTPMMVAIHRLNIVTMRCIIRNGEAVRRNLVVDCREESDQHVKLGISVIRLLLRFGADVDARSRAGKTALHCATCDDAYEVAKFLLYSGANVNARDKNGKTPLHYCVQEDDLLVTNLLLSQGTNIDVGDTDGITPLILVVQRANLNLLQLFLNHHQLVATPQRQDFGAAVLHLAVDFKVEKVARFIVHNNYASVAVRNLKGETAIHRAILARDPSMMELLADMDSEGVSLTAVTNEQDTPAHYAARFGSQKEVATLLRCLISAFGDLQELPDVGTENPLNAVDRNGATCLYLVGLQSWFSNGSENGNAVSAHGVASRRSRDAKAHLLLDHGAQLFRRGFLIKRLSASNDASLLILPAQVQRCLQIGLVEAGYRRGDQGNAEMRESKLKESLMQSLTDLSIRWIASSACLGPSTTLLGLVTCAGYALEVLPLLLGLPLRRQAFPVLLRQLQTFARFQHGHALLLQLHNELSAAWSDLDAS